jgi:hypothetical protein
MQRFDYALVWDSINRRHQLLFLKALDLRSASQQDAVLAAQTKVCTLASLFVGLRCRDMSPLQQAIAEKALLEVLRAQNSR